MRDTRFKRIEDFDASVSGNPIVWFDCHGYDYVSVQAAQYGSVSWSAAVLELVYTNFDAGAEPRLFSATKELTNSAPIQQSIDVGTTCIRWIGARLKTAESSVRLKIFFSATAIPGSAVDSNDTTGKTF